MIKVVLVKTPVVHDTEPLITILYNWFGAENVVADEKNDWRTALKYHDVERLVSEDPDNNLQVTGNLDEWKESKIILLQDNVVLHPNAEKIMRAKIPTKGSYEPFYEEANEQHGPEVDVKIKKRNKEFEGLVEQIKEHNFSYLNVPVAWWEEDQSFDTSYVAFNSGDTKELYSDHTGYEDSTSFYTEKFHGVIWPTSAGAVVNIKDDSGKEDQWREKIEPTFPAEFNPRDKFTTALAYSEEMHKPFFSLEEGLNQHVAMVFFHDFSIVDGMPL